MAFGQAEGGSKRRDSRGYGGRGQHVPQRVWQCPRCGRTRQHTMADARAPICRQDLAEMRATTIRVFVRTPGPNRGRGRGF